MNGKVWIFQFSHIFTFGCLYQFFMVFMVFILIFVVSEYLEKIFLDSIVYLASIDVNFNVKWLKSVNLLIFIYFDIWSAVITLFMLLWCFILIFVVSEYLEKVFLDSIVYLASIDFYFSVKWLKKCNFLISTYLDIWWLY